MLIHWNFSIHFQSCFLGWSIWLEQVGHQIQNSKFAKVSKSKYFLLLFAHYGNNF